MVPDEMSERVERDHLDDLIYEFSNQGCSDGNVGFEQITKCELEIKHIKDRLANGNLRRSKKQQAQMRLFHLEQMLAKLKSGHTKVAQVLKLKAQALSALPREMRDAILENIYVQSAAVEVTWARYGDHTLFIMPKDDALYMSAQHVGPQIAQEAAEIFYKRNTFAFVEPNVRGGQSWQGFNGWYPIQIDCWFTHDHYGSGITPQEAVRSVRIYERSLSNRFNSVIDFNTMKIKDHTVLEAECENQYNYRAYANTREVLATIQKYTMLQEIQLAGTYLDSSKVDVLLRIFNPAVRQLKSRGIKVSLCPLAYELGDFDDTVFFDPPTDEDYASYYQVTGRSSVFTDNPDRDLFDTWRSLDNPDHASHPLDIYDTRRARENVGMIRVWLHEHYEVYQLLKRDSDAIKKIRNLALEVRGMGSEERHVRRRYYARLLEFFG